jgi:hypothetical protein
MKIFAICRALEARRSFNSLRELYKAILKRYRKAFLVPYVMEDGLHRYRPAKHTMLVPYIDFLRSIEVVDGVSLSLSMYGRNLMRTWRVDYNQTLLSHLDKYLDDRGLNREMVDETIRKILYSLA